MEGRTMSGKQLEALCQAAGYSFTDFARSVGLRGAQIRSFRAAKVIDFSGEPINYAYLEQMRDRLRGSATRGGPGGAINGGATAEPEARGRDDYDNDGVHQFLTRVSRGLPSYMGDISLAKTKTVRAWRERCDEIASNGPNPMHAKRARALADALTEILKENGVAA
jgi:hypothetical protein